MVTEQEFNNCDAMRLLEGKPEDRERILKTAVRKGNVTEFPDGSSIVADYAIKMPNHSTDPLPFQCDQADSAP